MRPDIKFISWGTEGTVPNVVHKMSVNIDDRDFHGQGKNEKRARKMAAQSACEALFGVQFEQ